MQIRHQTAFEPGITTLVERKGKTADMLMDFSALVLSANQAFTDFSKTDERAFLLVSGEAQVSWQDSSVKVQRSSLFDETPWTLLVPRGVKVEIKAGQKGVEFYRMATDNETDYEPRAFLPSECQNEFRGKGTMNEASTRIVRTIFDDTNMKESKLVLGEVIGVPGKWSSYPPHHHPQPEIYHYRFLPSQGFGLTAIGDTPYILHDRDTILIRDGEDHPQVTAPGYAMWYLWVIRHLDGNRYGIQTVADAHKWVSAADAPIWSPKTN